MPDLLQMIQEKDEQGLREFCEALFPGVVAEMLDELGATEAWEVLKHAPAEVQAEIFPFFSIHFQVQLVDLIGTQALSQIIEDMSPDDRVDLLERLDPEHVESVLRLVAQAERSDIRKLLSYPEDSAGSIMTTEYASLPVEITVKEALDRLRVQAPSRETIYYVYVTDEGRHLQGFLSLRKLILEKPNTKLGDIMQRDVISVRVDEDQEVVAQEIARYDFIAIPVVDNQNRLVGIVTHDDAADVMEEEATEDAHMLGAVQPLEDGYVATPFFELARKRGVWLIILLGAASLTARVLQLVGPTESGSWMVLFLPMVLASGGNAGSQSATLVIRALALDETKGRVPWIAWREIRIGALLGSVLAALSFFLAQLMVGNQASVVVMLTVFCVVSVGTITGAMLPLGLKRLGLDPAFMSTPLIAALSDMFGVVIYYTTASFAVHLIF
ncbi:magnesium transporter [Thalassoglobus polymorphus]|uniref:Magnesium transporter MgtE n=1 Tax=Thalassoglobus polymorphus TaxID=2527994 RepID=A0A517QS15_9PLAN|nr:magnesium transporter [Thalassoglobus polymorphus]QDT34411.1 Magnesium transporter MgtE [Thalassoglobus polymorphus]